MEAASPWHWGWGQEARVGQVPPCQSLSWGCGWTARLPGNSHSQSRARGGPGAAAGCVLPLSGEEATLQRGAAFAAVARFPHGPSRSPRAPRGDVWCSRVLPTCCLHHADARGLLGPTRDEINQEFSVFTLSQNWGERPRVCSPLTSGNTGGMEGLVTGSKEGLRPRQAGS